MLDIALKEWAVVVDLMLEGGLTLLLRKGGIHEIQGPGRFELEHRRFLLFPSWLHQKPLMMKEQHRPRVQVFGSEPHSYTITGVGEAARIWRVPSRRALDSLDALHCWTAEHLDMRWNYKPQNPLYLVAVRVSRLPVVQQKTIAHNPEYGGCKSWVPLRPSDAVDDRNSAPVLCDADFASVVERGDATMM